MSQRTEISKCCFNSLPHTNQKKIPKISFHVAVQARASHIVMQGAKDPPLHLRLFQDQLGGVNTDEAVSQKLFSDKIYSPTFLQSSASSSKKFLKQLPSPSVLLRQSYHLPQRWNRALLSKAETASCFWAANGVRAGNRTAVQHNVLQQQAPTFPFAERSSEEFYLHLWWPVLLQRIEIKWEHNSPKVPLQLLFPSPQPLSF